MSRNGSEGRESGLTLTEVVVGMVVATILVVALVRFYKDSYKAYSLSEQVAERDQNARFVVNKFVEVFQQAGSGLPDTGWAVLRMSGKTLIVGVNPRGGEHFVGQDASLNVAVAVSDAKKFANTANSLLNTTHVLIDYANPGDPTRKRAIDISADSGGFVKGIKDNPDDVDSIRLDTAVRLSVGDRIYAYREDHYLLNDSNLVIRPNGDAAAEMVLAENIDSLGFTFRDAKGVPTTVWKDMRSVSMVVRARTEKGDPKLPKPGYRKISLPMNIILRNRI